MRAAGRLLSPRASGPMPPAVPLEQVLERGSSPLELSRLLIARDNPSREAALARYLEHHKIAFRRHAFTRPEGRGETFIVEEGSGDRTLVLCAHHDAVPASPGANDNAAAVGILLHLIPMLPAIVPRGWRVRLLFTAAEELDYLGARAYAAESPLADVAGVLSLELCGIGDAIAIWDAIDDHAFLAHVAGALERAGLERDRGFHIVGRIPVFGSDHRAFAAAGIPAYGFTIAPSEHAEALRALVLSPMRSTFRALVRRPPPFDTYHTSGDRFETLESTALELATHALVAIIETLGRPPDDSGR